MSDIHNNALKDLQRIPGVGKAISRDLWRMGFRAADELKDKKPEDLYEEICDLYGTRVDRCVLYVFRCAVYFVSHEQHDPEKLKWWSWKENGAAYK